MVAAGPRERHEHVGVHRHVHCSVVSVTVALVHGRDLGRSRAGITWSSFDSARNADSPTPATLRRRPVADRPPCDGLLGVQQQWGQRRAGAELVAAAVPLAGVHRIPEVTQAFDIAAHAAGGDGQALGQFLGGPYPPGLAAVRAAAAPGRSFRTYLDSAALIGQNLSAMAATVKS